MDVKTWYAVHTYSGHENKVKTNIERLEKGLESRFNNYRATLAGQQVSDNDLRAILGGSSNGDEVRHAWEASKQIGNEVVGDLLQLVGLRNQAARDLGFPNYYSMMLELDELDERELFGLLEADDSANLHHHVATCSACQVEMTTARAQHR